MHCDIISNRMLKLSKLMATAVLTVFLVGLFVVSITEKSFGATGASLYLSPPTGTFVTGGTFTTSIVLNTNGKFINALDVNLNYPPDKLQIVSPSLGNSIVSIWTSQPHFDNQQGTIRFQGGVPNPGINTDRGVLATITFRVKSVGQAIVRIAPESKVLLNDGLATDVLVDIGSGIYDLTLPPPRGPIVVSDSHPDQSRWYKNGTVVLQWSNVSSADEYSYVLSDEPIDIPDNISEGVARTSVIYKNAVEGTSFFHVKALRNGVWGETSHFAVNVDTTPPADFPIEISPFARTSSKRPGINFFTTDTLSGLDHYEIKIVPRQTPPLAIEKQSKSFFIETVSPYSPSLELGYYDVIVRAYDKAGNVREVTKKLSIVTPLLQILGFGFLPRWAMTLLGLGILGALAYFARRVWQWHRRVHLDHLLGALNSPEIARKLKELQDRRSGYMKHLVLILALTLSLFIGAESVKAAGNVDSPPIVTTISKEITNEEIFYIGGKTSVPGSQILIYLQSMHDGQTLSATVDADQKGDWFYTHPEFFAAGRYLVWTQNKVGPELSAPSAQYEISVSQTAIQFGVSRISFETLYLIFIVILFLALASVTGFILYHGYHGTRKQRKLEKEVMEAEEAVKKGFLLLHRDIQQELAIIQKIKARQVLSAEDLEKEQRLLKDFEWVSRYIEKEVKDIERLLGSR